MIRSTVLCGFAIALLSPLAVRCQETSEHMLDVGGHRLYFKTVTPAALDPDLPVIVLDAGGGLDARLWERVQPALASEFGAKVVAYSRSGFGASDLPEGDYEIEVEVNGLRSGLEQLGLERDVVLVAHSYGGMLAHIYARRWHSSVSGIVFLDAGTPPLYMSLPELFLDDRPDLPTGTKRERATAREWAARIESFVTSYRSPLPPDIPIVVVSSETGAFPEPRQNEVFFLTHDLLAKAVERSVRQTAPGTDHISVASDPEVVSGAVRALFALGLKTQER